MDCVNWLLYKERCKAEDYTVLAGRLSQILPDLNRIFETKQLCDASGKPTGVYVKLVLVADKPFIRHVCGMLSHNANAFGAPFCTCCDGGEDEDDAQLLASSLYDFTMDKREHYGKTTFEDLAPLDHAWYTPPPSYVRTRSAPNTARATRYRPSSSAVKKMAAACGGT